MGTAEAKIIEDINKVISEYKPLSEEEEAERYEYAGEVGNANDSYEIGVDVGERRLADAIRSILTAQELGNDPAPNAETQEESLSGDSESATANVDVAFVEAEE